MGKRGPKPKAQYARKGATLAVRITAETRKRLDEAAEQNEARSLSQEVEQRLLRSFEPNTVRLPIELWERLDEAAQQKGLSVFEEIERRVRLSFGAEDRTDRALLELIGYALSKLDSFTGQSWITDPYTSELAGFMLRALIENIRPQGKAAVPGTIVPLANLKPGSEAAKAWI